MSDTIIGIVRRVREWSSGKGYFLILDNNDHDFYGFGQCKLKEGQTVELLYKDGTGQFSSKLQIISAKLLKGTLPAASEKGENDIVSAAEYTPHSDYSADLPSTNAESGSDTQFGDSVSVYMDRSRNILEQSCLKAAAQLVSELMPRKASIDWKEVAKITCYLKNYFVESIICQGELDDDFEV